MAISYRQTDTVAPCGAIQACSGRTPATDADAHEAQDGGTAGTTELACDVGAGATEACYMDELAITDATSLDSGTLTARVNVTSAQNNLTWEEIHVCRLNSSCTSQETLGSVTGMALDVTAGGVFSQQVSLSAASAHNAGDVVYLVYVFANGHQMTSRSINITPDQLVDTPFTAGTTTEAITASLAGVSSDSAAPSATDALSGTLSGVSTDSAAPQVTDALSGTLTGTSGGSFAASVTDALAASMAGTSGLSVSASLTDALGATLAGSSTDSGAISGVGGQQQTTKIKIRLRPDGWVHPKWSN